MTGRLGCWLRGHHVWSAPWRVDRGWARPRYTQQCVACGQQQELRP
jgi:hypothetical protein